MLKLLSEKSDAIFVFPWQPKEKIAHLLIISTICLYIWVWELDWISIGVDVLNLMYSYI